MNNYDLFTGLASGAAIAGSAWDSGGVSWSGSGTTHAIGGGSNDIKGEGTNLMLGNADLPDGKVGAAVYFTLLTGIDTSNTYLQVSVNCSGAPDDFSPSTGVRFSVGGFGDVNIAGYGGGTTVSDSYGFSVGQQYCIEVYKTTNVNAKEYVGNIYLASGNVRGTLVKTLTFTSNTALSTTDTLMQLRSPTVQHPYVRIQRVETAPLEAAATVPDAPTIGTATAGNASASVTFTAPGNNGGATITGYTVTSTPGSITGTGASSPITVSGLTNGVAYTFTVHATNSVGNSAESAATSPAVTPAAPVSAPTGTVTTQTIDGQNVTLSGTTTNTPTSGLATLTATGGGAVTQGPTAITLGSGTFTITFAGVPAGSYSPTVSLTNGGGTASASGGTAFTIDGVGGDPEFPAPATVSGVSVSPSAPSVTGAATQQFTATVSGTNSPSQSVTWTASAGSISSGGLFTAPAASGSIQTITITATSTQDNTKSGTATATVPAIVAVTGVAVNPGLATVAPSGTQQFSANVIGTGSPSQAVTWSATAGSITTGGLFTAPGSVQTVTITATSVANGTKSGTATVTVAAIVAARKQAESGGKSRARNRNREKRLGGQYVQLIPPQPAANPAAKLAQLEEAAAMMRHLEALLAEELARNEAAQKAIEKKEAELKLRQAWRKKNV